MKKLLRAICAVPLLFLCLQSLQARPPHRFELGKTGFLLDGKPYQVISGEMHPARIPEQYWRHRLRMAKAMGCNTIAAYVFWNYHESAPGRFDFSTGNHAIARFIRLAQEEGLWVLLRPGPYVCAEWELGGLPPYLLRIPDIKLRCTDPRYMAAVKRYVQHLSAVVKPLLVTNGGPIILMQVENEYGSFGNDREYLLQLHRLWQQQGINIPFYTADGPAAALLEAGTVPGAAVGLDPGANEGDFALARKTHPGVPVFSSESYPGWLTHWGEPWTRPDTAALLKEVKFLMDNRYSFNLYVIHGGTNFGFTAGANSGGKGYEPDITSYDYDAPISEQGRATPKYEALRRLLLQYHPSTLPVPQPIPVMEIPTIGMSRFTSVWQHLPVPIASVQPKPFEAYGQDYGFMVYKTRLVGHKSGKLTVTDLHDYATVLLNGKYVGTLNRREGIQSIELPPTTEAYPVLELLVEGMGRINFAQLLIDRKGITDRVTLNGMTLMNWQVYALPMNETFVQSLTPTTTDTARRGLFFKGRFELQTVADTYLDMSGYQKGLVWVNGHALGRYWNIGPQQRLYCPAPWLKKGGNDILVFDLHQVEAAGIKGEKTLE